MKREFALEGALTQEVALTVWSVSEARAASSTWVQTSATVATENGTPS